MNRYISLALVALAILSASGNVVAQATSSTTSSATSSTTNASCGTAGGTCSEDFTGTSASLQWTALNDACLTAGNLTRSTTNGVIGKCGSSVAGYSIPSNETTAGQGALLLTPPKNDRTGAILSAFNPFPLSQGINITFTTYTFGGDSGGTAKNGADGIVFILSDGTDPNNNNAKVDPPGTAGGEGGSMGYGCSNGNGVYDGFAYGYLGLGIDEFGNFLNAGDNGSQGVWNSNLNPLPGTTAQGSNPGVCVQSDGSTAACSTSNTGNTYINGSSGISGGSGKQYQPERIGLRGAGNTNSTWLIAQNSGYYSGGDSYNQYNTSSTATVWTCNSNGQNCYSAKGVIGAPIYIETTDKYGNPCGTFYSSISSCSRATSNKVQNACRSGNYVSTYKTKTGTDGGTYLVPTKTTAITYNYNPIPGGSVLLPTGQLIANEAAGVTRNLTTTTNGTTTTNNPQAWPITYQLKISSGGLLSFAYSYNGGAMTPVLTNQDITSSNGPLPQSLRFGFSAGTGGDNNVHEITCFKASPLTSTSSAAANTIQSGQYKTGTQIYLASYSASPWWGSLKAIPLVVDSNGDLAASNTATWDGKCTLTSGFCDSLGTDSNSNPVYEVEATAGSSAATCSSSSPCIKGGFVNPEARVLVTATGANVTTASASTPGVGFSMQQALTSYPSAVQTAFASAATTDSTSSITMQGSDVLNWLLGQRCKEQLFSSTQSSNGPGEYYADCNGATTATGNLAPRTYVLGDIIDSSPLWVGAPVAGQYNDTFTDDLYSSATQPENQSASTYSQFVSNNATRLNMVYVGSNDGYLHGFEAGYFNTTSSSVTCGSGSSATTSTSSFSDPCGAGIGNNDGAEKIAYMPYDVLLDQAGNLTNPLGAHQYLVDATPGAGDLFYGNAWHTWLVGGVGVNGKEIYALDVTNPGLGTSSGSFTSTNAQALVMGDWDNNNAALSHLGNTVGTPSIVRMHNGQWAIIFGNGLNSGTSAGVYIGLVDKTTGAVTFLFLDTGVGGASGSSTANGIAYVTPVDMDGDGIMDYLYAGDQQGNVWRFDVTSNDSTKWSVSNYPGSTASTCSNSSNSNANGLITATCSPLFTATSGSGSSTTPQPITTGIVTATIQTNGVSRNMVYFGTGEKTPQTGSSAAQYAPASTGSSATTQQQAFYGIWDWNMGAQASSGSNGSGWNSLSGVQFASLTGTGNQTITTANLSPITSTDTTVTGDSQIADYRTLSGASTICWVGSSACSPASNDTQYGWYYNLPGSNEQIIYSPTIIQGAVVVNTAIPPGTSTTQCTASNQSGWTMAFDATSGNALTTSFFSSVNSAASGVKASAVGTPTAITYNGQVYLVSQTVTGAPFIKRVTPRNNNGAARVSWREIRN